MRLFLAIELPQAVRTRLAELPRHWQAIWGERLLGRSPRPYPACSWVREQNLHVTLRFLGPVGDERVSEVCTSLEKVPKPGALSLQPDRLELLPPRGPVRVIAVGFGGDLSELEELHGSIEAACGAIGFAPEGRKYRPHVTLARTRAPLHGSVRLALADAESDYLPAPQMRVEAFVLMESRLYREAAEYIPLARFPLKAE